MGLLEQLKELREQRAAAEGRIANVETNEELDKIELELRKFDMQIAAVQAKIDAGEGQDDPAQRDSGQEGQVPGQMNPIATFDVHNRAADNEVEDMYSTVEYRKAFKNYILKGEPIPEKYRNTEERAAEMTIVGNVAAVIPTTIQQKVIEDLTVEGKILSRVTQTSFQGGIQIPISEISPEATWLESEKVVSDEQKAKMEAKLMFSYHTLEARIAIGLLSATVSLPVFEATVVKSLKKAMVRALEKAIIAGTGSGQPLGAMKIESLPTTQTIEFDPENIETVKGWARVEAAVPEAYEDGEIYIMNKATWEMHLNSMTDTTGQKIGLGRINEKGQKILNGREVFTTDQVPSYDSATDGTIFGALLNLNEYCLNSNLNLYYKKYFDEDKNKWVHKMLTIADGKMPVGKDSNNKLVGAKGIIYFKKVSA